MPLLKHKTRAARRQGDGLLDCRAAGGRGGAYARRLRAVRPS